jgi:hypothetical protein
VRLFPPSPADIQTLSRFSLDLLVVSRASEQELHSIRGQQDIRGALFLEALGVIYRTARRLSDLTPELVDLVLRLAGALRPRPLSYSEITDAVLCSTEGVWVRPPLVRRVIACHAPELLDRRAAAREMVRPLPARLDRRRHELEPRIRALILSKATILVEQPQGGLRAAFTLEELGRLSPRPMGWQQVRRLIAGTPRGRELLEARRPGLSRHEPGTEDREGAGNL